MKKVIQFFISTITALGLLFGLGLLANPSVLAYYQVWVIMLATVVMFASQPPLDKKEFFNQSDGYSMIGIMLMAIVVTNLSVYDYSRKQASSNHPINYVGFLMIWIGLVFRIYAIRILGNYFSNAAQIKPEHRLCQDGIYAIIRHPSYTGAIATIVGTVLWLGAWQTLPISFYLIFVAYYHRITQEEKILTAHFGEKYRQYCKKTGALLPKIKILWKKIEEKVRL
jgi:protein-S-isoprenylcysteine O-methyltransferase Ste14